MVPNYIIARIGLSSREQTWRVASKRGLKEEGPGVRESSKVLKIKEFTEQTSKHTVNSVASAFAMLFESVCS